MNSHSLFLGMLIARQKCRWSLSLICSQSKGEPCAARVLPQAISTQQTTATAFAATSSFFVAGLRSIRFPL